ncbi:MAG: hypothetical protein ACLR23_23430 [Clostridia bacterium]
MIRIATLLNISLDDLFCLFTPRDTTLMEIQRLLANRTPAEKRKALDILTALFQDSRSTPSPLSSVRPMSATTGMVRTGCHRRMMEPISMRQSQCRWIISRSRRTVPAGTSF